MSNRLGPIEIICDAPPYPIVQACAMLEFERPLDVGWRHADRDAGPAASPEDNPDLPFRHWSGSHSRARPTGCGCGCGASLPALDRYAFQYLSGRTAYFYLGQCRCCQTIFWREE